MKHSLYTIIITILLSCGRQQPATIDPVATETVETIKTNPTSPISQDTVEAINANPASQECSYVNATSVLGAGIVMAPTTFEIFEDSLLTRNFTTINMYEDEAKINFCSIFHKPDYGIMHFVCLGETSKSFKVLIGFANQKYLPKKNGYEFKTWEKYILESFGVRRKIESNRNQHLKEQPLESSVNLRIPDGHELFCPMEIKGDWLHVKYDCFYNTENNPHEGQPCHTYIDKCKQPLTGWIKWRNQNELWIDIFLMP